MLKKARKKNETGIKGLKNLVRTEKAEG